MWDGRTDLPHGAHEVEHVGEVVVGDELAPEGPGLEHAVQRAPRVVLADLAGAGVVDGAVRVLGGDVVLGIGWRVVVRGTVCGELCVGKMAVP